MSTAHHEARATPRRDIQGLRAVAVLAVVANHLGGYPSGGFIGVDVFFVLSGFLITGLLLKESERHGRISFATFYRRRIRRIVPAATLVIAATVALTYVAYNDLRGAATARDGLWALVFGANWHFAAEGTDYFRDDGLLSPLQHYWSLSVEEQFYVGWPVVILLTYALTRRRSGNSRATLGIVAAVLTLASFGYSVWHTGSSPVGAYFSTFDRGWELGVGALIAVLAPSLSRLRPPTTTVLGVAGLVGLAAGLVVIDEASTFPAPWAALPVLSTGLILIAGLSREPAYLRPLTNPVAGYVGNISYSLYLWHFPVIVTLQAFYPAGGVQYLVLACVVMAMLSVLSYHLVEDPIRRSSWLEPGMLARRRARRGRPRPFQHEVPLHVQNLLLGGLVVTAVLAVSLALQRTGAPEPTRFAQLQGQPADSSVAAAPVDPATDGQPGSEALRAQQAAVVSALQATAFPDLDPALDELGLERWSDRMNRDGCTNVDAATLSRCRFGEDGAATTAVVLGDSYAISWMPGIRKALVPKGYAVQQLTMGQCPVWNAPVLAEGERFVECEKHRAFAIEEVRRLQPDLLVLASSQNDLERLHSQSTGSAARAEVEAAMADSLTRLAGAARRTVVLAPPPNAGNLEQCLTRGAVPDDCVSPVGEPWWLMAEAERAAAGAAQVEYLDTQEWFCASELCPAFTGRQPIRADGAHLTWEYSEHLAPLLDEALLGGAAAAG